MGSFFVRNAGVGGGQSMKELISGNLVEQIKKLLEASRQKAVFEVNTTLLHTYWQIGKIIVEDEALHIGNIECIGNVD